MAEIRSLRLPLPTGGECIIRNPRPSDASALIEYLNQIGGESPHLASGANEFRLSEDEEKEFIGQMNSAENSLFLVAEVGDRIVGVLTVEGSPKPRMRHAAELGVSVRKGYQRQGIGRGLMEEALGWAESNPVLRKINLVVHRDNKRAIGMYTKMGFVREGVISDLLCIEGTYHDCLYMGRAV